eukprot:TRINITY_DN75767_c0_g1_i1.p3 TRINITY_DN75767_c0_g1~~TRINITY_DN75767_c0_g1_i1.p3  ORF type:complete len:107 (+),score=32.61 TRINITY_DN75767_c0_g1_i1:206-526(+)
MIRRQAYHVRRMLSLFLLTASPLPLMAQTTPSTAEPATEEPILPDDQFEARLPKMEGTDANAPLPSIDNWIDQQMPAQGSAATELPQIGRAVQQECRDRSRMPSSA